MERHKLSALDAFDLLVVASQRTQTKLRDVAEALASTATGTALDRTVQHPHSPRA